MYIKKPSWKLNFLNISVALPNNMLFHYCKFCLYHHSKMSVGGKKNHLLVTTYFCITIFTPPGCGTSAVVWVVRSCQRIVVTTKQRSTGESCISLMAKTGLEHVDIIWKVNNVTVLISTTLELKWTEPVNIKQEANWP